MSAPAPAGRWANWAGDEGCVPRRLARPESVQEVIELVASAATPVDVTPLAVDLPAVEALFT